MTENIFPAFFKWSNCKSKDEKKPDIIELKVTELETWESEFSKNLNCEIKFETDDFIDMTLPMKSHESNNSALLDTWNKGIKSNRIHLGDTIVIRTWMGKSTKSDRPMRRSRLVKK